MKNKFDWQSIYQEALCYYPNHKARPIIGITANYDNANATLAEGYWQSVEESGAIPLLLTPTENVSVILATLDRIDGLLLSGGGDINPLYLDQEPIPQLHGINARRDLWELLLTRYAYDRQLPIFGICRGMQVLTCALGGTIYQDIAAGRTADDVPMLKHTQDLIRSEASHTVQAVPHTCIAQLLGEDKIPVNSFHHQAVCTTGPSLTIAAQSPDGVIEAVASAACKDVYAVQWHPECFILQGDRSMMPLFQHLTARATLYREARSFHQRHLTLDSHCDTPMFFPQGVSFDHRDPKVLVDLHKMTEGGLDATIMVAYLPQHERTPQAHDKANARAHAILDQIDHMVHTCKGVALANTPEQLYLHKAQGLKSVMRGIENGYAIGHDIEQVAAFRQRGVVYMTLCHNGDNDICDAARQSQADHGGVSIFGESVITEMNRVGMLVDLSHAAETSFYDALDISTQPVVCSHSSARTLCDHVRNLTDDQLLALAQRGGVAQVTLYAGFLRTDAEATIYDAVEHLKHMIHIAGIEHVGIGTDFDGDGGIRGCASASELINFTKLLLLEHLSEADLQRIWGGNFLRVMQQVQQAATADFTHGIV